MDESQVVQVLKQDALGRVELVSGSTGRCVRRVACGGGIPGSGIVARRLLRRERAALERLDGLEGVPRSLVENAPGDRILLRSYLQGVPLHAAEVLPEDFFALLLTLVRRCHGRGVCHNDLHKEANILVAPDGRPAIVDFQLASVHPRSGRHFAVRAREDERHVHKHELRYRRAHQGPEAVAPARIRRSFLAWSWLRFGKPVYNFVTRRILRTRDGEPRRSSQGPWPRWSPPVGPADPAPRLPIPGPGSSETT